MTKEEEKYTTLDTEQCKWWVNNLFGMAKEQACNSHNFDDAEEMQSAEDKIIKSLEIVEEFERAQIITGGRLNGRTYAYKCGLEDGKRKALEQQSSGVIGIVSPCKEQTTLAEKLRQLEQPTSDDCVSRQMVKEKMIKYGFHAPDMTVTEFIEDELPPVTPTHGTCKECKYSSVHTISLDKIDEIRVCRIQFSKQIKDDYYCANYEKRGSENG